MALSFRKLTYCRKVLQATLTGRRNVHFLHIRKTGGTALKTILGQHLITDRCVLHLHPHRVRLKHISNGHQVMFVTRDPVSRFVSGFGSRQREGAPAHHVPWSPEEARAFKIFSSANELALALHPEHPQHEDALSAMNQISHLQCSYWDWFGNETELMKRESSILFIGQIETFAADFEHLKSALGLPSQTRLPEDPVATNHSPRASTALALTEDAKSLVKMWYQKDYDFLEFCQRWREKNQGPVAR
jgi:hypothetical protein